MFWRACLQPSSFRCDLLHPPIRPGVTPAGSILCCPSTITTGRTGSRPPPGFSGVRARRMRMRAHAARLPPLCPTGTLATSGALRTSLDPSSWPHTACGRGCASAAAHPLARPRHRAGRCPNPSERGLPPLATVAWTCGVGRRGGRERWRARVWMARRRLGQRQRAARRGSRRLTLRTPIDGSCAGRFERLVLMPRLVVAACVALLCFSVLFPCLRPVPPAPLAGHHHSAPAPWGGAPSPSPPDSLAGVVAPLCRQSSLAAREPSLHFGSCLLVLLVFRGLALPSTARAVALRLVASSPGFTPRVLAACGVRCK